jgi:hypothetical protein
MMKTNERETFTTWHAEQIKTWAASVVRDYIARGNADRAANLAAELAHYAKTQRS